MRALVAGLGNVFESDDGFGVAVARSLAAAGLPEGVAVADFGIRGIHLAYQLLDGYDLVVIVDAVARGGDPGTLYVIEHAPDARSPEPAGDAPMLDAHDLSPDGVLGLVPRLGGRLGRVVVIGCEPRTIAPGMGLSEPVASSVENAARLVIETVQNAVADTVAGASATTREARIGGG